MVYSALIFLFDLFLEARAESITKKIIGFLVDLETQKCPFEIN